MLGMTQGVTAFQKITLCQSHNTVVHHVQPGRSFSLFSLWCAGGQSLPLASGQDTMRNALCTGSAASVTSPGQVAWL